MKRRIKTLNARNPIYRWRMSQRLGLATCAKRIGVSGAALYNWEIGKSIPHDLNLYPLAEMIGIKPEKLLRDLTAGQRAA